MRISKQAKPKSPKKGIQKSAHGARAKEVATNVPPCGLCQKKRKQRQKTPCCDNWVCGSENEYVMFSYSRDICVRNHDRYTICAFHYHNRHKGPWITCKKCRSSFDTEDYVDMATNEYNFEKLPNPPTYEPTICTKCKNIIVRAEGGYSTLPDGGFECMKCNGLYPQ